MNYYNEWDKGAAAWLRELIKAGLIPNGYVDDRSITDVTPSDLEGFTQCHFFAGIGGWSYALQLAGIPASTRLWTGSPPCQPFSVAGKQLGQLDERHLAPTFMRLVAQCKPPLLFGEQVAAAINKRDEQSLYGLPSDKILDGVSEILGEVGGWTPSIMQRMPAGIRKRLEGNALRGHQETASAEQTGGERLCCAVPHREPGKILDCRMPSQVCEEGDTLRPGSVRSPDSREDGERGVRIEQNPIRPDIPETDRLHAISGQDRSGRAVHDRQCADSLLGHQRTIRGLGRTDGIETLLRLIDEAGAPNSEREIASIIDRATEVSTGSGWLDDLFAELERQGYACGAAVLPAASVGAPHKRDRLFFGAHQLGNADSKRHNRQHALLQRARPEDMPEITRAGEAGSVADTHDARPQGRGGVPERADQQPAWAAGLAGGMADADGRQSGNRKIQCGGEHRQQPEDSGIVREGIRGEWSSNDANAANPHHGFWSDADWLGCRDGKFRPVITSFIALVDGFSDSLGCGGYPRVREKSEVFRLPEGVSAEAFFFGSAGKPVDVEKTEILRSEVHGKRARRYTCVDSAELSSPVSEEFNRDLYELSEDGRQDACTSQGREPFKQRPVELDDLMRELSQQSTLAELQQRDYDAQALSALRDACAEKWSVQHSFVAVESVWSSFSEEDKERERLDFNAGIWRRIEFFPLSSGEEGRVGRLRGYGNAIVPQVAAEFIKAFTGAVVETETYSQKPAKRTRRSQLNKI